MQSTAPTAIQSRATDGAGPPRLWTLAVGPFAKTKLSVFAAPRLWQPPNLRGRCFVTRLAGIQLLYMHP